MKRRGNVDGSTVIGECVYVKHDEESDYVDVGVVYDDGKRGERHMENETIEEAVGFIETATDNIKNALKRDCPRNGVTLEEFIQLLERWTTLTVYFPMMGRLWSTKVSVTSETVDGMRRIVTDPPNDDSILKRRVDKVFVDNGCGSCELCVRIAEEGK